MWFCIRTHQLKWMINVLSLFFHHFQLSITNTYMCFKYLSIGSFCSNKKSLASLVSLFIIIRWEGISLERSFSRFLFKNKTILHAYLNLKLMCNFNLLKFSQNSFFFATKSLINLLSTNIVLTVWNQPIKWIEFVFEYKGVCSLT